MSPVKFLPWKKALNLKMYNLPKPQFILLTDLGHEIHDEGHCGTKRKNTLDLLEEWKHKNRQIEFSASEAEQMRALSEVLELATKITREAFIPPWERSHYN